MSNNPIASDLATFKQVAKRQHKALQKGNPKAPVPSLMELQESLAKALGFKDLHAAQQHWKVAVPIGEEKRLIETFPFGNAGVGKWKVLEQELLEAAMRGVDVLRKKLLQETERYSNFLAFLSLEERPGHSTFSLMGDLLQRQKFEALELLFSLGAKLNHQDILGVVASVTWDEKKWEGIFKRFVEPMMETPSSRNQMSFRDSLSFRLSNPLAETPDEKSLNLKSPFWGLFLTHPSHDFKQVFRRQSAFGWAGLVRMGAFDLLDSAWAVHRKREENLAHAHAMAAEEESVFVLAAMTPLGREWLRRIDPTLEGAPGNRHAAWSVAAIRSKATVDDLGWIWKPETFDGKDWSRLLEASIQAANRSVFEKVLPKLSSQEVETVVGWILSDLTIIHLSQETLSLLCQALERLPADSRARLAKFKPIERDGRAYPSDGPWNFLARHRVSGAHAELDFFPLVEVLLGAGAYPDQKGLEDRGPLHHLVAGPRKVKNRNEMVELFKRKGASLRMLDKRGQTPWKLALALPQFNESLVEALLPADWPNGAELSDTETLHYGNPTQVGSVEGWVWLFQKRGWSKAEALAGVLESLQVSGAETGLPPLEHFERALDVLADPRSLADARVARAVVHLHFPLFQRVAERGWSADTLCEDGNPALHHLAGPNREWWLLQQLTVGKARRQPR